MASGGGYVNYFFFSFLVMACSREFAYFTAQVNGQTHVWSGPKKGGTLWCKTFTVGGLSSSCFSAESADFGQMQKGGSKGQECGGGIS